MEIITKQFICASGEVFDLSDDVISRVPYLTTLLSAAQTFPELIYKNRFYRLDSQIQSCYFQFIIDSMSFNSVRQYFTHLLKRMDILDVFDFLDFLGIPIDFPTPSLIDIDESFFNTMLFKPSKREYFQKIRVYDMQDMAVLFAIALAQDAYDSEDMLVLDQIYWFVMFILSAFDYFGPRLRYHVQKIAVYYFAVHSPTHLKSLKGLIRRCESEKVVVLDAISEDYGFHEVMQTNEPASITRMHVKRNGFSKKCFRAYLQFNSQRMEANQFYYQIKALTKGGLTFGSIRRYIIDQVYSELQYFLTKVLVSMLNHDFVPTFANRSSSVRSIIEYYIKDELVTVMIKNEIREALRKYRPLFEAHYMCTMGSCEIGSESIDREQLAGTFRWASTKKYFYVMEASRGRKRDLQTRLAISVMNDEETFIKNMFPMIVCGIVNAALCELRMWKMNIREIDPNDKRLFNLTGKSNPFVSILRCIGPLQWCFPGFTLDFNSLF